MASAAETLHAKESNNQQGQKHIFQLIQGSNTNNINPVHGTGLLTTITSLPLKYRSCYITIPKRSETPLDLSVKQISTEISNEVPIAALFTEVYTEPSSYSDGCENESEMSTDEKCSLRIQENEVIEALSIPINAQHKSPLTPPSTPTKRKLNEKASILEEEVDSMCSETKVFVEQMITEKRSMVNPMKIVKVIENSTKTPVKPIRSTTDRTVSKATSKSQSQLVTKAAKNKATRKLKFDEDTSSPVSGTIIRPLEDITDGSVQYSNGDIDPKYNIVEMTQETKAELAAIKNIIGDYICKLCLLKFEDVFGLAQHRCACIVILEYRCPECGKQFNCAANLASHRRWHKAKDTNGNLPSAAAAKKENQNTTTTALPVVMQPKKFPNENQHKKRPMEQLSSLGATFACDNCGKLFKRQAYLRKHQLTHSNQGGSDGESKSVSAKSQAAKPQPAVTTTTMSNVPPHHIISEGVALSSGGASLSSSSPSSSTTYLVRNSTCTNGTYEYEIDSMSDRSDSSNSCGYLQIVESGLTEEENIAAAALTNLRNCATVIQHTTLSH